MPENEEATPETTTAETVPQETVTAPEAEPAKQDPWADPEAARKEIERLRREAAGYRTKVRDLEPLARKAKELEDAQKSEAQRLAEQLAAAQESVQVFRQRAVRAEVRALAAAEFADPDDAHAFLDLDAFVGDDGEIDTDRIRKGLADLLKRKPHLARDAGPRAPRPDRTQGSSGNGNRTPTDPASEFAGFLTGLLDRR